MTAADETTAETTADRRGLDRLGEVDAAVEALVYRVVADRGAVVVALAAVVFSGAFWRAGFTVTDSYTVANTLVALSHGHLAVLPGDVLYGPANPDTPGMHVVGGRLYGRNFGQAVAALPVLLALRGLGLLVDLRLVFVAAWSLCLFGVAAATGDLLDRHRAGVTVGVLLALGAFAGNLGVATGFDRHWLPLVALQSVSVVAGAATCVFLYRLLTRLSDRRVGLAMGLGAAFATPVGLWAVIPKRHALVACFTVGVLYALYAARAAPDARTATRYRATAYGLVALTAWVHGGDAFLLLVALAVVDLPTARFNSPRTLAVVAAAFLIALLPFFVTNTLVGGNPLVPPRLLPNYGGHLPDSWQTHAGSGGSAPSQSPTPGSGASLATRAAAALTPIWTVWALFSRYAMASIDAVTDPTRLVAVFVRSGLYSGLPAWNDIAVDLTVLESMPLLGGLAALPVLGVRRLRQQSLDVTPARVTDAFALCAAVLVVLAYLDRLPLHYQLTMRYLHPLYPLGAYALARTPGVRRAITDATHTLAFGFTTAFGCGIFTFALSFGALTLVQGEAAQLYAHVALVSAAALATWSVLDAVVDRDTPRVGAAFLATAAAAAATYYLLAGVELFARTDSFLLPLARFVSDHLHLLPP